MSLSAPRRWLLPCALAVAAGCGAAGGDGGAGSSARVHVLSGGAMGSTWRVDWHGPASPRAVEDAVHAELAATDRTFSLWNADSELQRFNAHRSTAPFPASERLRAAATIALSVAAASAGAFDPTVGPLSGLFRAAKADPGRVGDAAAIAAAIERVGYTRLHVAGDALRKDRADVEVDLDGLVAGLCADRIGERLRGLGVAGCLLQITGEVLCHGTKPDGSPWSVGIVDPEASVPGHESALLAVPLRDAALCTSGTYANFVVQGGQVRSHVVDPRTGGDPGHGVVSVSVLARSCALADALDTALLVTGPEAAAGVLARCGDPTAGAWFVIAAADGSLRHEALRWPADAGAAGAAGPGGPPA